MVVYKLTNKRTTRFTNSYRQTKRTKGERMIEEIMIKYGIRNYDFDLSDKTLLIYQVMYVSEFVKMRNELRLMDVNNIIVKSHKKNKINV